MVILFASLNAMDPVCCPDGCTYEQAAAPPHNPESQDEACMLCLGGVISTARLEFTLNRVMSDRIRLPHLAQPPDAPSVPVDHPPRS